MIKPPVVLRKREKLVLVMPVMVALNAAILTLVRPLNAVMFAAITLGVVKQLSL